MRRWVIAAGGIVLLGTPAVLSFFAGGYFTEPRLVACLCVWLAVLALALLGPGPLPAGRAGRIALAGLALITAITGASIAWAPLREPATQSTERMLLYLGVFLLAVPLVRDRRVARALEPAFALGALATITYGLAGRLLPLTVTEHTSIGAGDRLDQPITYWNAEGAIAAIGLVLCARVAGDGTRPRVLRVAAAAASAPLGLGLYLSYSRGALAAIAVGLLVLLAAAPTRAQGRALVVTVAAAVPAALLAAALPSVAKLASSPIAQQHDGRIVALVLAVTAAAAALATAKLTAPGRREEGEVRLRHAGRLPLAAGVAALLAAAGLVAGGLAERNVPPSRVINTGAARLVSVASRRYDYWRIGVTAWSEHPLRGIGAGGFRAAWLERRPVREGTLEIHSLELEMLVELGLAGALGFALFAGGVLAGARRALREEPALVAGAAAACTVWILHATIDWDWQVPALTLPALVLAARLTAPGARSATRARRVDPGVEARPVLALPDADLVASPPARASSTR